MPGSCGYQLRKLREMGKGFKEEEVVYIISETLKGIDYFHKDLMIHRSFHKVFALFLNFSSKSQFFSQGYQGRQNPHQFRVPSKDHRLPHFFGK
jgi:hypothetical protein